MLYRLSALRKMYGRRTVLDIGQLVLHRGRVYALLGPNGAGKTTLLNILAFLEAPTRGEVVFDSRPVKYSPSFLWTLRQRVVLVDQQPILFSTTVYRNLEFGLKVRKIAGREREHRIMEALEMVGMTDFVRAPAQRLSGGETQRVALAARLVLRPEVLLLDEPTANIDAASAQLIKEAVFRAREQWKTTLVIASHDQQWVYEVCDDVLRLFRGHLLESGTENVVFGPWQSGDAGRWGKRLADGQWLGVSRPPHPEAVAIIPPVSLVEFQDGSAAEVSDQCVLNGFVLRLTLEKKTGEVLVTVLADNIAFVSKMDPVQVQNAGLHPGRRAAVTYPVDAVSWV